MLFNIKIIFSHEQPRTTRLVDINTLKTSKMQQIEIPEGAKVTIEGNIIKIEEAKFEPKEGDIVVCEFKSRYIIAFYTSKRGNYITTGINKDGELGVRGCGIQDYFTLHPATEVQKDLLLNAMQNAGYRYNYETHEVEKVRWVPKVGEAYWTISLGAIGRFKNEGASMDKTIIDSGLAFQTKEEGEAFFEQVKELAKKR